MVILYTIMATINRKRHAKIALILKNPIAATLVVSMGQMSAVMLGEIASTLTLKNDDKIPITYGTW